MSNTEEQWSAAASARPDVFGLPKIAPQGQDGVGHFNYYDQERQLSFQWDGRYTQHVTVSHGGYGEPVKWTFDFLDLWCVRVIGSVKYPFLLDGDPFSSCANHFQKACDNWIATSESDLS